MAVPGLHKDDTLSTKPRSQSAVNDLGMSGYVQLDVVIKELSSCLIDTSILLQDRLSRLSFSGLDHGALGRTTNERRNFFGHEKVLRTGSSQNQPWQQQ